MKRILIIAATVAMLSSVAGRLLGGINPKQNWSRG